MEHSREALRELRYDLQRSHHVGDHPLAYEVNEFHAFQQPSYALQLRDTDDLQPLELGLFLQDDACCFHQYRQKDPFLIGEQRLYGMNCQPL
jgi:hypothetical protein